MEHTWLKQPPMQYRPGNYWGWLENITPEETSRQVEEMARAGLGGFVAHARGGLEVPFMGKEWIQSVHAAMETGKRYGLLSIFDDEDGWPSGFGAGKVNGLGKKYWVKWLECETVEAGAQPTPETLGLFALDGETLHVKYGFSEYYVDNMDPDVVQKFIDVSYEEYAKEAGDEFGKGFYGIFSDEPQLARYAIPWSETLPAVFQARYGYDLLPQLYKLFRDAPGAETVRYHFWQIAADLFETSYGKQIGDWCRARGVVFTGHTTIEEDLPGQMQCSGSTMQFYTQFDMPGIDWLCRVPPSNMAVKQLSSVAQQYGKARALSEMYGCCGWNVSFEEMKWLGEWQYVLGVDYMLQHLGLYSLKGSRKREYPASLFFQQPWWPDFPLFNEYFARLSMLLANSRPVIDTLVLHAIKSVWISYTGTPRPESLCWENAFKALTDALLDANFDFHYGDETLLARSGRVSGGALSIENYAYTTVILPAMRTIDTATLLLLRDFANAGGRVLAVGSLPTHVDGVESDQAQATLGAIVTLLPDAASLLAELSGQVVPPVRIRNADGSPTQGVYTSTREREGRRFHYIVNTSFEHARDIIVETPAHSALHALDLESCQETETHRARYRLEPAQSLVLFEAEGDTREPEAPAPGKALPLTGAWRIAAQTPNSLTLDRCRYAFAGGAWSEVEIPVIQLQEQLVKGGTNGEIEMEFTVQCAYRPTACDLVLETPEAFTVTINGAPLDVAPTGWWVDPALHRIPVAPLLREGENKIRLKRAFYLSENVYRVKNDPTIHEAEANRTTLETELESIYLLGDFSVTLADAPQEAARRAFFVREGFQIAPPVRSAEIDELARAGYPFFAGSVTLDKDWEWDGESAVRLSFARPDAIVMKLAVNGTPIKTFGWAPYEADITAALRKGQNTIALTLTNSLRNLFGPHHSQHGELYAVGPFSFHSDWNDAYSLVRFGIEGGITLHVCDKE